ncbi:DinB family protein [Flavobacteriaceae bacterium XHP0103]|uniref:DinB family protein n=1 Tax=Marixanthotalea marina TaxID=2844359 RepID=UPI002989E2E2|nr:DinB family protein [Marixanthotalea marina]MBU3821601.1 DinB family protein [Marixanthotalea marina]
MKVTDLSPSEYGDFYRGYIGLVPTESTLIEGFVNGMNDVTNFFMSIPEKKWNKTYAQGKWTIKEVFQHIIDTERIFQYRCFRIARHDATPLVGFEQDDYIIPSQAKHKTMESLVEEFKSVRQSFITLLYTLSDEDLKFVGNVSGYATSARGAAFITLGHYIWHINILKERYL